MGSHLPPTEQQGQYRYDPRSLHQAGPARIFPYIGDEGIWQYLLTGLPRQLVKQGRVSQPWSLLWRQVEATSQSLSEGWAQLSTLLADVEIFQSGWFNFHLPPNEQFDADFVRQRRSMMLAMLAAKRSVQAVQFKDNLTQTEVAGQQRTQFYQALKQHGRAKPVVAQLYERDHGLSDREFARQRLAGQNPMVIRQVQRSDQPYLQSWQAQSCTLSDGTPIDLVEATTTQRLFVADYPCLQGLTPAQLQAGRYVGSPIAIFHRSSQGLEPILIQVEPGRVVLPPPVGTDADAWMRAKLYVQVADVTHHELISHLSDTHLGMEAFAIATCRQLPANHPLYQLLRPHFRFLLAINTRGNEVLLGESGAIDQLMAPTRAASLELINQAYRNCAFQDHALPQNIQHRGVDADVLPEFPYRDDAKLLWHAITRYVSRYLQRYYPDDHALQQDPYLLGWIGELGDPLNTRPWHEFAQAPSWLPSKMLAQFGLYSETLPTYARVPGFPTSKDPIDLQQLIDIVTQIIFTCGPQHAAVNFSQFDYVGYPPNAPLAAYCRPDSCTSLEDLLPPPTQDLGQIELSFALSGIRWGTLGSSELIQFAERGDRQILAQLQADLQETERTICARNQQRLANTGVDYPYLLPSHIPNSINI
ncbi:lipoxygenase family protein [Pantanalinema sp. GBBB05]|uniref:lipoxygenase family protein n=1 Tax=Pantanalinema sp. GBBB05 TaxID=2604139 RepID=UPI001E113ADB|nr:lipoxygenase [Pantanalinema sp. GBBB05]